MNIIYFDHHWDTKPFLSILAACFIATLLSVTVMLTEAKATEFHCHGSQTNEITSKWEEIALGAPCFKSNKASGNQLGSAGTAHMLIPVSDGHIVLRGPIYHAEYDIDEVIIMDD